MYASNNMKNVSDGTDVHLLPKSEDVSGESGRTATESNDKKHFIGKNLLESDNSSALLTHSQSHGDIKSAMKFIDATIGNDYPPSAVRASHGNEENKLTANDRNLSNVSISRTVEFIEANGERHNSCDRDFIVKMTQDNNVDSAIEESISSMENNHVSSGLIFCHFVAFVSLRAHKSIMDDHNNCNKEQNRNEMKWNRPFQVYHIKSNNNCLQILAVQVEPSSSSGIDLPLDNDSPPRFVLVIAVWLMTPP